MGWNRINDMPIRKEYGVACGAPDGNFYAISGNHPNFMDDRVVMYDGSSWTEIEPIHTARIHATGAPGPDGYPIIVGGFDKNNNYIQNIEWYNGSGWDVISTPFRLWKGSAFNGLDGNFHVIVEDQHWVFDGNDWTEDKPTNITRQGQKTVNFKNGVLCFGDRNTDGPLKPEVWDGSSWTLIDAARHTPNNNTAFSSPSGNAVSVSGTYSFDQTTEVHIYNGSEWNYGDDYPVGLMFPMGSSYGNGNPIVCGGRNYAKFDRGVVRRAYEYIPPQPPTAPTGLAVTTR